MKNIIIIVFLFAFSISHSQQKLSKELSGFDVVKVFDRIQVKLVKAPWSRVDISGINRDKVVIVESNNVLKIKMSLDNIWDNDNNTKVIVYYKNLRSIDANEGSKVIVEDTLEEEFLDVRAQEGAIIEASIATKKLFSKSVTGGEVYLTGTATEQEVIINSGGKYLSQDLKTKYTQVKISAGGIAEVNAQEYIKANTNAGGTIKIYGNPKTMDTQKLLGGKIIEVN
ncbi:head GIN domain-containing protein [Aquimarina sp. 2304DJ70-9]|uniref:head GIN domain-containing protein n=1 Tax=Aquimarina penaris TaxID=3231044 RepID=UPI0034629CCC